VLSAAGLFRYGPCVWFGVLGRLEVRQMDGGPVAVAGPVRRRVLAALLCRRGESATAAALIDDAWGAAPPRSALGTLRSHVVRLRDDLGRANHATVLITEGDGYRLAVDSNEIDSGQFEQLLSEAATISATVLRHDRRTQNSAGPATAGPAESIDGF